AELGVKLLRCSLHRKRIAESFDVLPIGELDSDADADLRAAMTGVAIPLVFARLIELGDDSLRQRVDLWVVRVEIEHGVDCPAVHNRIRERAWKRELQMRRARPAGLPLLIALRETAHRGPVEADSNATDSAPALEAACRRHPLERFERLVDHRVQNSVIRA